jgi:hypothetical protein
MTHLTEYGTIPTKEFAFGDNLPVTIMSVAILNINKSNVYTIDPNDIELTIPANFVPISASSEELTSTLTYSIVTMP